MPQPTGLVVELEGTAALHLSSESFVQPAGQHQGDDFVVVGRPAVPFAVLQDLVAEVPVAVQPCPPISRARSCQNGGCAERFHCSRPVRVGGGPGTAGAPARYR